MQYHGHLITKSLQIITSYVLATHIYSAFIHIIKTADQVDQTGLRASGTAQNTNSLTGFDLQINTIQYRHLTVCIVSESHIVKPDASVSYFIIRIFRIGKVCFLIQYLNNSSGTCHTHGHHNEDHGEHHQTHENIHTVGEQTHQFACSKTAAYDHIGTEPTDSQNTCIDCKLHQRSVNCHNSFCIHEHIKNVAACLVELLDFIILTDISFYDSLGRNIFLYAGIHLIVFRKSLTEIFHCFFHNEHQTNSQKDNSDQIDACDLGIDKKCHCHRSDQADRCSGTHTQDHLVRILNVGHIRSQTSYQTCCGKFVNIGKGKRLNIGVHGFTQISGKTCGCPCSILSSQQSGTQTDHCYYNHADTHYKDMLHVTRIDAIINNGCHHQRNEHFHRHFNNHTNRCLNGICFKFFYLCK